MRSLLVRLRQLSLLGSLVLLALPGWAQHQYDQWYFGNFVGLQFQPGRYWPQQLTRSTMTSFQSCTTLADSLTGELLFYTNGERIWDRRHQLMPGAGFALSGNQLASEGALALFAPGQPGLAYVFTTDAKENSPGKGFNYCVVDRRLRGGLGDVTRPAVSVPLPGGVSPTEHLAAVRHPNGRDYWLLVHGRDSDRFYAYLLTPAGLAAPVVSAVGPVFGNSAGPSGMRYNASGTLRFAPTGRQLAATLLNEGLYLFDFDPQTGRVSNDLPLHRNASPSDGYYRVYGCEFSGDGSLLYGDDNGQIARYDLLAGSPAAIRSSRRVFGLPLPPQALSAFRRGPNNRLYVVRTDTPSLVVIDSCNSVPAAYVRLAGQPLRGQPIPPSSAASATHGLPNFPARVAPAVAWTPSGPTGGGNPGSSQPVEEGFAVDVTPGCAGQPSQLAARLRDPTRGSIQQAQWSIGPSSAPLSLSGAAVAATFGQPGPQPVYVVVTFGNGTRQAQRLNFTVPPLATVQLRAATTQLACGQPTTELTATASGAGRFSWDDDTTRQARRLVSQPGTYRVRFLSAAGCPATDSVTITQLRGADCLIPNVITPDGDAANQRLVLQGYEVGRWQLTVYNRWGRPVYANPQYANEWDASGQPAGLYYYLLVHPASGNRLRGWVEVVR